MVIEADPTDISDAQLIREARSGDERAYGVLYERYNPRLVSGLRISLSHDIAEDAAQEAWLRAYQRLDDLQKPESFFAWLATIARNSGRNARRRDSGHVACIDDFDASIADTTADPETLAERGETRRAASSAFLGIPQDQRHALVLRWIHGRSYESIARLLGRSVSAVETLLYRARANFHRQYESAASGVQASSSMACYKMRSNLRALRAGTLTNLRRRRVLLHLDECDRCRSVHQGMGDTWARPAFLPVLGFGGFSVLGRLGGHLRSGIDRASALLSVGGATAASAPIAIAALGVAFVVASSVVPTDGANPGFAPETIGWAAASQGAPSPLASGPSLAHSRINTTGSEMTLIAPLIVPAFVDSPLALVSRAPLGTQLEGAELADISPGMVGGDIPVDAEVAAAAAGPSPGGVVAADVSLDISLPDLGGGLSTAVLPALTNTLEEPASGITDGASPLLQTAAEELTSSLAELPQLPGLTDLP